MSRSQSRDKQLIHKMFQYVLLIISVVSVFNIVGNIVYGFPLAINIKWIFFIFLSMSTYYFTRDKLVMKWKFLYFFMIVFIMLPISFIDSGGSSNNTIGYLFLIVICVTFFFWGWQRNILIISIIGIFIALISMEHFHPELIKVYSEQSQLLDRLVQITLLLFMTYLFLKVFSDAYSDDKRRLDQMVHFDSLTGLYNRRSFDEHVKEWLNKTDGQERYLLFFDIDNFKEINDSNGHTYGDQVIQSTADELKKVFFQNSVVARWGGDEYAVLYEGDETQVIECIEGLLKENGVSLSCGLTYISENASAETLLKQADKALYQSKNNGKNQWFIFKG